jgi:predicted transposase/invertase (TIGR01784 family)
MLPLEKPIVSIEYQTGELIPELAKLLRHTIVDVRCTDDDGRQFLVEMQMYWSDSFKSRVLLNASKAYLKQLDKAEDFHLLQPVFALNFVNEIFEKSPEMEDIYQHHYKIFNTKYPEKQIEGMEFAFIELPKFKPQNRAEKKLHNLWMLFLTKINEGTEEIPDELMENELTCEAVGYMERAAYTKDQLAAYDKFRDAIMIERSIIGDATRKGEAIGLKKGEVERTRLKAENETAQEALKAEKEATQVREATLLARIAELEQFRSGK